MPIRRQRPLSILSALVCAALLASCGGGDSGPETTRVVSFGDSLDGDCVIFNAWAASTPEANRFLVSLAREIIEGKDTIYFKRHYKDGSTRPARLRANDFVARHLQRQQGGTRTAELAPA